jgi:nucleotide-binding universal stress UspA family protein
MTGDHMRQRATGNRGALRLTPAIVVGLDGSAASMAALRWAVIQSRTTELPVRVVHAWQVTPVAAAVSRSRAEAYFAAAAADARARATNWVLETLGDEANGVHWTLEILEGGAGPVLVALSQDAPLLVLGTRVHTGIRRAVQGSVSHYCLSHAAGPVVAVPGPPAEPADTPVAGELTTVGPLF